MFCQWRCLLAIWQTCQCGWKKICPTTCRYILSIYRHRWPNFLQNKIDEFHLLTICSPRCGIETNNSMLKHTDTLFQVSLSLFYGTHFWFKAQITTAERQLHMEILVQGFQKKWIAYFLGPKTQPFLQQKYCHESAEANTLRLTHMWCKSKHCTNIRRCIPENLLRLSN